MSISLDINGSIYFYPSPGDVNWGQQATNWAQAVTDGMLQKSGGNFTLLADVNFGASYGLLSKYFTSISSNAASAGVLNLANTDLIAWKNGANNADIALGIDSSNNLTFTGQIDISSAFITGNLSVNNLNSGTDADSGSFWCGDGTWKAPSGSGAVNSGTATQLAYYATSTNAVSSNTHLTVDSSGNLTAVSFVGPLTGNVTGNLTGNVTGNVSGSSGSCTGNAATVTTIPSLSGDISNTGNATTVSAIQTVTVSGTTGTTNVVFSNSPTLVTPTLGAAMATTPSPGDSSTNVATTSFIATSFAPLDSAHLIGIPLAPTASPGTNTTQLATTAFVATSFAPLVSPALTGTPTAPTAAVSTNTTQIATTAFVMAQTGLPGTITKGTQLTVNPFGNTNNTVSHGLGIVPDFVDIQFVCLNSDLGYSAGDVYRQPFGPNSTNSAYSVWTTSTTLGFGGAASPSFTTKNGNNSGQITNANWEVVITPFKIN